MVKYSIIIPTYNRPKTVLACLKSLVSVAGIDDGTEVIVIENSSAIESEQLIKSSGLKKTLNLRLYQESDQGLQHARHCGARHARGEILMFVDDDVRFSKNWLNEIARPFQDRDVGVVSGKILVKWDQNPGEWVREYLYLLGQIDFGSKSFVGKNIHFNGGNMAIRKDILIGLGGFPPDQIGKILIGNGEVGLYHKLNKTSWLTAWAPKALVWHLQSKSKNASIEDIVRRVENHAVGEPYQKIFIDKVSIIKRLALLVKAILFYMLNSALYLLTHKISKKIAAQASLAQIKYIWKATTNSSFYKEINNLSSGLL